LLYEQNPFMYFTLTADGTILSVNRFDQPNVQHIVVQADNTVSERSCQVRELNGRPGMISGIPSRRGLP
jgi:hypothetical protein